MTTPQSVEADLGWALFTVVRDYRRMSDEALAGLPGGPRGYQVLAATQSGGPSSQLALAQHLGVDRTVMTYLLDDLESAGLVERRPDPADRRARRIVMTEAGGAALCGAHQSLRAAEEQLLEPIEAADRETLRSILHRLATRAAPGEPVTCTEVAELTDTALTGTALTGTALTEPAAASPRRRR